MMFCDYLDHLTFLIEDWAMKTGSKYGIKGPRMCIIRVLGALWGIEAFY
jgi:hypothetical protein